MRTSGQLKEEEDGVLEASGSAAGDEQPEEGATRGQARQHEKEEAVQGKAPASAALERGEGGSGRRRSGVGALALRERRSRGGGRWEVGRPELRAVGRESGGAQGRRRRGRGSVHARGYGRRASEAGERAPSPRVVERRRALRGGHGAGAGGGVVGGEERASDATLGRGNERASLLPLVAALRGVGGCGQA